ncbi:MAG: class I adenylate-forming enzyme family protein [Paracoccaceae bacterium]
MLSIHDTGAPAPCPAPFNLAAHVLARAGDMADKIALAVIAPTGSERWSYARLEAAVLGTGSGLLAAGLAPGDRIFLRLGNTVDFPLAFLGAVAVGLVPVPLSAQLTAPEVGKLAAALAPVAILQDERLPLPDPVPARVIGLRALRAMRDLAPAQIRMTDPDALAYVVFTSGTSGTPRAVGHAHRAIWARRMMHDGWYGLTGVDRVLHAGAFNWTFTLGTGLLDPWSLGATALIPAEGTAPEALPLLMKRFDASIFAAAPGIYRKLLARGAPLDLPALCHGLAAGEKLPDATRTAWEAATGTPVFEAFGMSECSTFISGSPARPAPPGTLGYPQEGRRVAILDEQGRPVPRGEAGIIAISARDPGLMLGYLGAEAETRARHRGAWFLSGDLGRMDETGAISFLGRADDMMNAGGVRVSPIEVENVLSAHPALATVAVTDVQVKPDVRVIACFYTAAREIEEKDIADFAAARLARWKQPRLYIRTDTLPTGPNGKLSRRALRQNWETTHGQA